MRSEAPAREGVPGLVGAAGADLRPALDRRPFRSPGGRFEPVIHFGLPGMQFRRKKRGQMTARGIGVPVGQRAVVVDG